MSPGRPSQITGGALRTLGIPAGCADSGGRGRGRKGQASTPHAILERLAGMGIVPRAWRRQPPGAGRRSLPGLSGRSGRWPALYRRCAGARRRGRAVATGRRLRMVAVPNFPVPALRPLAGPGACRLRPPERSAVADRHHRHQWQDDDQPVPGPCLSKPCAIIGTLAPASPTPDGNGLYHAGSDDPDALSGRIPRPPRRGLRTGGQFHRHRGRADERRASRCGGIHQFHPRSSGLPRLDGSLCRCQGKLFHWPHLRTAVVINVDDELGRKLLRETSAMRVLGYGIGERIATSMRLCVPRR